jgi:hypothetical protein
VIRMANTYTAAIPLFEREAEKIRAAYDEAVRNEGVVSVERILQRDDDIERCQWAIEMLHAAWVADSIPPIL